VGTAFASGTPGYQLASVSLVSADANNRYAVTSTPTGFALLDLQTQSTMLTGTTPSAVRGLAMDPLGQMIYLTAAESNSFITVPGPPSNNQ
jgi:DNA-binding beta-propeller fold protein YncE